MKDHLEPIAVDIPEACRLTGIGRSKLYELLGDGEISSFRIGKRRLIKVASLRAWVDQLAEAQTWCSGTTSDRRRLCDSSCTAADLTG